MTCALEAIPLLSHDLTMFYKMVYIFYHDLVEIIDDLKLP